MKRNSKPGKDRGKAGQKNSSSKPTARGSGDSKTATSRLNSNGRAEQNRDSSQWDHTIPVELQQLLLNIFRDAFPETISSNSLKDTLQEVKSALFDRDFTRAFGTEKYLEAYSIRWSPSRALCYASILVQLRQYFESLFRDDDGQECATHPTSSATNVLSPAESRQSTLKIVCIGGGAAETVACGGLLRSSRDTFSSQTSLGPMTNRGNPAIERDLEISNATSIRKHTNFDLTLIDVAQWSPIVQKLHECLITPPPLSKYASAAIKEANSALIASAELETRFYAKDVLDLRDSDLQDLVGQRPTLVTLLFTLNELYATSIGKTTKLLLDISTRVKQGSLLLVVDSPGSYSETVVGTESKKYPMKWLLDHTLLETLSEGDKPIWHKLVSEDSLWFRLSDQLRYPIPLENMRYQMHLYRRL